MAIQIFNGVVNALGTPSVITNAFASRPVATDLAEGTLFFCSDTPDIYQVISGNWKACGGGGGGSQTWQDTLNIDSSLNKNNSIDALQHNLIFENLNDVTFRDKTETITYGFYNDNFGFDGIIWQVIPDFTVSTTPTTLVLDQNTNTLYTSFSTNFALPANAIGISLNTNTIGGQPSGEYYLGDWNGIANTSAMKAHYYIRTSDATHLLQGHEFRLQHDVNDESGIVKLNFTGANWTYTGATKTTTLHLIVYVNGVEYLLPLFQRN